MWLTDVSIRRPLFILMVVLALVLMGSVAYTRLGAEQYPNVNIPFISVVVAYPGAGPEEVESRVTRPIEDALAGVSQLKNVQSYSLDGLSLVSLEFNVNTDTDTVAIDVERKVAAVRSSLPDEAKAPNVVKSEYGALPIMNLALTGGLSQAELFKLADEKARSVLESVKGVASVRVVGGREREILVKVDQPSLRARGLAVQQVQAAIAQGNLSMPSGSVEERGLQYNVRYTGLFQTVDQLRDLVVYAGPTGTVYLKDVAVVEDGFKQQRVVNRYNGTESVGLLITKQASANTMLVADDLRKAIARLQSTLPSAVDIVIANDISRYVKQSLDDVQGNLRDAIILTGIVLLLFLHTVRSTIIVLLAIPTSLIATFMMMWIQGFTLNMMSMMGLALTIGILVDDSIVVLENIFRHLELGETPWTAALNGRGEIGLAAIAITLVDVVVYVPVAFMSGMVGQFFRQFGLTVAVATLFSLFISFTLTPMLASRWLKREERHRRSIVERFGDKWEAGYDRLAAGYGGVLSWSLRHRPIIIAISAVAIFGAVAMLPLKILGTEFVPPEDQAEFNLIVEMPPGTALESTSQAALQVESKLGQIPEILGRFTTVGISSDGFFSASETRYARIALRLVEKGQRKKSLVDLAKEVEQLGTGVPGLRLRSQLPTVGGDTRQPFLVQLRGEEVATLTKVAGQISDVVTRVPGTANVTNSAAVGAPEVRFEADHRRLADLGLTSAQVALTLRANVEGLVVSQLRPEGKDRVDIRLIGSEGDRGSLAGLPALPVVSQRGTIASIDQATSIRFVDSPAQITRLNRQRLVTIGANVVGRPLGDVVDDFQREVKSVALPPGYSIVLGGQTEMMDESFTSLIGAQLLSIVLMYMLMVALYESLLTPFVVMFSIPVALSGAFGALLIAGKTLNIASMIGIVMLLGLVGKNAILLVDYTNTLRKRGLARDEAIEEAGPTRLRPILMTTAAMVAAMLPASLQIGQGSETRSPMAVVVIGGLISSTLLTLVLVPVVYTILDDIKLRLGRLRPVP
ncbi:MAG: efflux RND transporter permease subunit [Chloroflexi bacterium]|nr:efflux RND transporter permease subunit [Chloroflexota bacterium]